MSHIELKNKLQQCGIVGAGGAGFPTYAKLAPGADTLVLNCAECEPLLYTDYMLMQEHLGKIAEGAAMLLREAGIARAVVAIKRHRAEMLGLAEGQVLQENVFVKLLPDVYPMGDEIQLIYEATGRLIPPGSLPITKGVIVLNGETVYNVYAALTQNTPVTEKWVTVAGDIQNRTVVRVPVGMRVRDLFKALDVTVPDTHVVIDGGPSMGRIVDPRNAVVGKTTKSLLILPREIPAVMSKTTSVPDMLRRAASCCCGCSRCTEMCPRNALGYPLEPHKMIRAANNAAVTDHPEMALNASLCCSCGICAAVCCQDISPKDVILSLKGLLAKNGLRYATPKDTDFAPAADRAYHMIPSIRWESMLGVKRFDLVPELIEAPLTARQVEIALRSHIGAPSVPTVKIGDTVKKGEVIAAAADGLSLPQHASIDGKVTLVDNAKIVISAT